MDYCVKKGEYDSNFYEADPYDTALRQDTFQEAIDYLWKKRPRDMALSAHNIEENIRKKFKIIAPQVRFYGPFPRHFYPPAEFDPITHSLLLVGEPGIGKTQFARYMLGDCDYVKSNLEKLRTVAFENRPRSRFYSTRSIPFPGPRILQGTHRRRERCACQLWLTGF